MRWNRLSLKAVRIVARSVTSISFSSTENAEIGGGNSVGDGVGTTLSDRCNNEKTDPGDFVEFFVMNVVATWHVKSIVLPVL